MLFPGGSFDLELGGTRKPSATIPLDAPTPPRISTDPDSTEPDTSLPPSLPEISTPSPSLSSPRPSLHSSSTLHYNHQWRLVDDPPLDFLFTRSNIVFLYFFGGFFTPDQRTKILNYMLGRRHVVLVSSFYSIGLLLFMLSLFGAVPPEASYASIILWLLTWFFFTSTFNYDVMRLTVQNFEIWYLQVMSSVAFFYVMPNLLQWDVRGWSMFVHSFLNMSSLFFDAFLAKPDTRRLITFSYGGYAISYGIVILGFLTDRIVGAENRILALPYVTTDMKSLLSSTLGTTVLFGFKNALSVWLHGPTRLLVIKSSKRVDIA
eukprot:TRINITY_DN7192_c0_g1_i4.p1 TRINITY_DN7192_c0_g1~~TRINITY_DN7192_c0_g1_i4.p1  ORF type:complete len:319 (-),score=34.11 TRINITY_DN7192_c0_g1_i4:217-1173(-)